MQELQDMRHVVSRITEEGLVFEIFDTPQVTLFDPATQQPTIHLNRALQLIVEAAQIIANDMALSAHLASVPLVVARNPVWDVSTQRAHAARLAVQRQGFPAQRIQKVTGYADRKAAVENPMSVRNNRVEVVFLREGA